MNKIPATVKSIANMGIVSYITVEINGIELQIMKSKIPEWLEQNDTVFITFQELSVCVGTNCDGKVSIENKIPAKLLFTRINNTLCELVFKSEMGEVVSLMTEKNFFQLKIDIGSSATLLLRDTDIHLEPNQKPVNTEDYVDSRTEFAN